MAESDAGGGLYAGLPDDATIDSIDEDPAQPGWAFVKFSDGRTSTLPTETARSMPQTAPAFDPVSGAVPPGAFGADPALPDQGGAMGFGELPPAAPPAAPGQPPVPEGFSAVPPIDPAARPGVTPAGGLTQRGGTGMEFRPEGSLPGVGSSQLGVAPPSVSTGEARTSQGSEIVAPAGAGGAYAPFSRQLGEDVTTDTTADSPKEMQARLGEAGEAAAQSFYDQAVSGYDTTVGALHQRAAAAMEQEAAKRREKRRVELAMEEHKKVIDGIEKNPLDEDAFWTERPGRRAAAWIALALSGFLQGATKGQNPALNQMMASLNGAKEDFMRRQQASRESILKRRTDAMGDERTALASVNMQIDGLMSKYMDLQAQAAGTPLPPSLATVRAQKQLEIAQEQNKIGSITTQRATQRAQEEERATPASQTPLRRGDVVLQQLGLDKKAVDSAWDPNDGNVPGTVTSAERMQEIKAELDGIRQKHGNELPQQNLLSYSTVGAAGVAARLGDQAAADQLRARGLLSEVEQMLKQSSATTKLWDSNQEREDLIRRINTGETGTTMEVVDRLVQRANQNAVAAAQRYTRDPQGLIDFVRKSRQSTQGVTKGAQPKGFRPLAPGQPQKAQEGGAQPPLAGQPSPQPATQEPPSEADSAAPTGSFLRGTYRQQRASRLSPPR